MNAKFVATEIEYPESDGEPIGETDLHIHWIIRLRDIFKHRYRGQRVYVAADLLLYYEEGVPRHFLVPDVFVVKDCDPGLRRVYKLWEEGQAPHFVMEVTSAATRNEDEGLKPRKYARIGVAEYFLYDPTGDYLQPVLQGHRLVGDEYKPIAPDENGRLYSAELGIWLSVEAGELMLHDAQTGERLLTAAEAAQADAEAAHEENRRLRETLRRHGLDE